MPRHCIFCSEPKLTEEDIWPEWFKRWLRRHPQLKGTYTITRLEGDTTTVEGDQSQSVGGKRLIACESCNGKRMGPLQDQASAILKPMLDHPFAEPQVDIVLTPTDQATLAAWATMTAMTAEFLPLPMPDLDEVYFTQDERVSFLDTRNPLPDMVIASGQYVGPNATAAYFSHSAPGILDPVTEEPTGATAQLYVVTLNLFHVFFQLAFYREPDMRFVRDGKTVLDLAAPNPTEALVPIWPIRATEQWPPQYSIGDDTFLDFCRRWNP